MEREPTFKIAKGKPKHLCVAYRCKKNREAKDRFCSKHSKRYQRDTNPIAYTLRVLRNNAKRRGKECTLTLKEFTEFCIRSGYLDGKGTTAKNMSIDRIDNTKGYTIDNIRILSVSENTKKRNEEDYPF